MKALLLLTLTLSVAACGVQTADQGSLVKDSEEIGAVYLPTNGSCSSPSSNIKFAASRYQGGQAPLPGTITSQRTMTVDGSIWAKQAYRNGVQNEGSWPVETSLTNGQVIATTGSQIAGSTTYSALLTVKQTKEGGLTRSEFVICQNSWLYAP